MLRGTTIALALAGATIWGLSIWTGLAVKDALRSDGLQWMAAFFATPPFVLFTLPALVLIALNKAPRTAIALAALGLVTMGLPYVETIL